MNVIFFDGYCGLCNGFVNFMMKVDHNGIYKFSPLQSDYAKANLKPEDVVNLKTLVVILNGKTYKKAPGVLRALANLGGAWKLISILRILPSGLLNIGYDLVASNRYRLFGKSETCRLPTPVERTRFIL